MLWILQNSESPQPSTGHPVYRAAPDTASRGDANTDASIPSHVTDRINDLAAAHLEQILSAESANGFGQRLTETRNSGNISAELTAIPIMPPELSNYSTFASMIQDTRTEQSEAPVKNSSAESSVYNYRAALESIREYLGLAGDERINHDEPVNSKILPDEFSHISLGDGRNLSVESVDNAPAQLSITHESQVASRFSKPIVVAEVPNYESYEYSTTFPCSDVDDERTESAATPAAVQADNPSDTAVLVTPKLHSQTRLTTSPVILNPIQAGVALVNAGKTHFISRDAEAPLNSAAVEPQNPGNELSTLAQKDIETSGNDTRDLNVAHAGGKSKLNAAEESTNIQIGRAHV